MEPLIWIELVKTAGVPTFVLTIFLVLFFRHIAIPVVAAHVKHLDMIAEHMKVTSRQMMKIAETQDRQTGILESQSGAINKLHADVRVGIGCRTPSGTKTEPAKP